MDRLRDHWKPLLETAPAVSASGAGDSPAAAPRRAVFRGVPIWIHPAPGVAGAFASDEGSAFLPNDALANVQLERYVPSGGGRVALLKRIYYLLKPLMPRSLQLEAQRANARSRLANVDFPAWPRDDSARRFATAALASRLEETGVDRVPFLGFWPAGCSWAACFTHDVETAAGLAAVDEMAGIEEERGVRSTWFVVPERYPVSPDDFRGLRDRGHEIGVHGLNHDGRLFSSREEFSRRVPRINAYLERWGAVGFRSPALYRNPDWIPDLAIRYDSSTMDTAVLEPQPGGACTVHPFHLNERVVELPITMPMDHHLINLLRTDVVRGMLEKLDWVVERHGLANFLFHPDYNLEADRLRAYRRVVETVATAPDGWIATAAAVADWWARRRASTLAGPPESPRIEGPAAADGAIWWARLEAGGVVVEPGTGGGGRPAAAGG